MISLSSLSDETPRSCFDKLSTSGKVFAAQGFSLTLSPSKGEREAIFNRLLNAEIAKKIDRIPRLAGIFACYAFFAASS